MRYIHFFGNAGYCGTNYDKYLPYTDGTPDSEIEKDSKNFNYENASNYTWICGEWEDKEDEEIYYKLAAATARWEEISKKRYRKTTR